MAHPTLGSQIQVQHLEQRGQGDRTGLAADYPEKHRTLAEQFNAIHFGLIFGGAPKSQ
jgi:hypothetical protein